MTTLHAGKCLLFSALFPLGAFAFTRVATAQTDITAPGNAIVGVTAVAGGETTIVPPESSPANETPPLAIDDDAFTKYLNFLKINTGLIVTPTAASIARGIRVTTANDAGERDPLTFTIEGTNSPAPNTAPGSAWSLIASGDTGLLPITARLTPGPIVAFANSTSYASYRVLFPTVRNAAGANSMQLSELEILGVVPEPSTAALLAGSVLCIGGLRARGRHCS